MRNSGVVLTSSNLSSRKLRALDSTSRQEKVLARLLMCSTLWWSIS